MTKRNLTKTDAPHDAPHADASPNSTAAPSTQEVAAVWVPRSALHAWAANPRKNDGEPVKKVMESIKRFGFAAPIVARTNGEVIAGHTRLKAAEALGLDRVPVRYMDLDPAEAHLLALADNKLNEEAEWDASMVASVLSDFSFEDAALAGWDSADLDKLASKLGANSGPTDPMQEWQGMPEFDQQDKTSEFSIIVHFDAWEHVVAFARLLDQSVTKQTKSIWFPKQERMDTEAKRYGEDD